MKHKVLFLINAFAVGGAQRVLVGDINALVDEGWEVHVATLFSNNTVRGLVNVSDDRFHVLGFSSCWDVSGYRRLAGLLRRERFDCMLTTQNDANFVGRIATMLKVPPFRLITREANSARAKGLVHKFADILIGRRSTQIAVVSKAVGESIFAYAPWLRKSSQVFYNGTDFTPCTHVGAQDGSIRLLSVGRFTKAKDHLILLHALVGLPEQYVLTLVGYGPLAAMLKTAVAQLSLAGRVFFKENVPFDRMPEVYAEHDIFVLPSEYEGCPNVVTEAQAVGLPIVAFDIAGMREFVPEGSGLLVGERRADSLAAAIAQIGDDHALCEQFVAQGYRALAETRSIEAHRRILMQLLTGSTKSEADMRDRARRYLSRCAEYTSPDERERLMNDWERKEDTAQELVKDFHRRVMSPAEINLLEVGFGNGVQTAAFSRAGARVHGLEVNPELRAIALEYLAENSLEADLRLYDGRTFPYADASMDAVYTVSVLEHVSDPYKVVSEIARCLRPGGRAYVAFPNRWYPRETHTKIWFLGYVPRNMARVVLRVLGKTTIDDLNLHFIDYWDLQRMLVGTGLELHMERGARGGFRKVLKSILAAFGVHYSAILPHIMVVLERK